MVHNILLLFQLKWNRNNERNREMWHHESGKPQNRLELNLKIINNLLM